jgi:cbb3-type cytochrome oxidase maturation protein
MVEIIETHGGGIEAGVGERSVIVGSPAFVESRAKEAVLRLATEVDALIGDGLTPVLVAIDGRLVAAAGFGDPVRADARAALARVRGLGWRLGILSGDHARVVAAVGAGLGLELDRCRGGVSPEGKLDAVAAAFTEGPVVMVGDGVNDAAALAAATVGIAVHGGAEAALAAADVFVMRPDDPHGPAQPGLLARLQRDRRRPGHERRAEPARGRDPDAAVLAHRHHQLVPGADVSDGERPGGAVVSVMFILLPVALLFSAAALGVFLWASASGQFDDLETPGLRILHEDDEPPGRIVGR